MLSRKEIQLDLLRKFNELCQEANVKYALHDQAAVLAYRDEPIDYIDSLKVMMCQGDAERIADILDDDRYYFEDFRSNPKFDRHYMMFGYKDSLDLKNLDLNFKTDRHIENHCIRINISFINHQIPKGTGKKLTEEKKEWNFRHMELHSNKFWRCRCKKFKSDAFNELVSKELEGIPVYILKDFDYYASTLYSNDWHMKGFGKSRSFESSNISWEEFSQNPKVKECMAEIQRYYELMYFDNSKLKECQKKTSLISKHVIQSANVFNTRKEYIAQKDDIMDSYNKKDLEKLGDLFSQLIESQNESLLLGYSFSVDEDIDKIFDEYLRETKRVKLANKINKLRVSV